jgi:hypothetical protein
MRRCSTLSASRWRTCDSPSAPPTRLFSARLSSHLLHIWYLPDSCDLLMCLA